MINRAIPLRRCIGCNQSKPKEELDRYVIRPMEKIYLYDPTGKAPGRVAYICKGSEECLKKAIKRKRAEFRRGE
ncbi:MAG: YlxR family protein, partial [Firmicutes bacterium]|nr:YlxR family protein [Bacillota bacterium]